MLLNATLPPILRIQEMSHTGKEKHIGKLLDNLKQGGQGNSEPEREQMKIKIGKERRCEKNR